MKASSKILLLTCASAVFFIQANKEEPDINLNEPYFTIIDTAFFNALMHEGLDLNKAGKISSEEAATVTYLRVPNWGISDMTGIETFVNLDTLSYFHNALTQLDVSNIGSLKYLHCGFNNSTQLDVSGNTALDYIYLNDRQPQRLFHHRVQPVRIFI